MGIGSHTVCTPLRPPPHSGRLSKAHTDDNVDDYEDMKGNGNRNRSHNMPHYNYLLIQGGSSRHILTTMIMTTSESTQGTTYSSSKAHK